NGHAGNFSGNVRVTGDLTVFGAFSNPSDSRLKEDVVTLPRALETVLRLRGVSYHWRKDALPESRFDSGRQIGFIAQEVMEVVPEVVRLGRDGFYAVDYSRLVPVLVEAVKEQRDMAEAQRAELAAERAKAEALERRIQTLEALVAP